MQPSGQWRVILHAEIKVRNAMTEETKPFPETMTNNMRNTLIQTVKAAGRAITVLAVAAPELAHADPIWPEVTERAFLTHKRTDRERDDAIAEEIRQK
jgi:hypothetical protein